jgi:hypothetical protein
MGQGVASAKLSFMAKRAIVLGFVFVGLNVADALLTQYLLGVGGTELNLVPHFYLGLGSNNLILVKGLLPVAVVIALMWFGKARLLRVLNWGMVAVLFLNVICVLAYLAGVYSWF